MNAFGPSTADQYHPATFHDRGVALAFTTPLLAGARVRESAGRGKEVVIHNPSGGRGVYVIPIAAVPRHFRPTVHDVLLLRRIAVLATLTPATVRKAAWSVARDGFAGSSARDAVESVAEAEHAQVLLTEFHLLRTLVEQIEPKPAPREQAADAAPASIVELRQRGRGALTRLSRRFGRGNHELGQAMTDLAALLAPVGLGSDAPQGRTARLLAMVERTRSEIAETSARANEGGSGNLGHSIIAAARIVLSCADAALAAARALAADPIALLARWFAGRGDVLSVATRAEWFLDGWEQICLLWQISGDHQTRLAALFEIAQIIPVLPREAVRWSPLQLPASALAPSIHVASHNDDWRSGSRAVLLIDRNERMRAMSL